ncbi:MAG: beta-lactamase family protein, partial [Akkermansiaceae bacterium]|nr:beta-lactamase family protein [Akkermansiaceae bacterium]
DDNKRSVTIRHLLTHTSGFLPGIRRGYAWSGYHTGIALACGESSVGRAGATYLYSDINFILLGEIVQRVTGEPLDRFAASIVFDP